MTRTFANRFNRMYKVDYFPEPQAYNFGEDLNPGLDSFWMRNRIMKIPLFSLPILLK